VTVYEIWVDNRGYQFSLDCDNSMMLIIDSLKLLFHQVVCKRLF